MPSVLLLMCGVMYAMDRTPPWQTLYELFGRDQYFTVTTVVMLILGTLGFATLNNYFYYAALAYGGGYIVVVLCGGMIFYRLDDVSTIAAPFHGIAIILLILAGAIGWAVRRRRAKAEQQAER